MAKLLVVFVLATVFCVVWADSVKGVQGEKGQSESGSYRVAREVKGELHHESKGQKGASESESFRVAREVKGEVNHEIKGEQVKAETMRIVREANPHKGHYNKGYNKGHNKGWKGKGHH